jgi:hypothetical protein
MDLARINGVIEAAGLTPLGAFHPKPDDAAPALADGQHARTLVLAGNAGPAMWRAFSTAREPARDLLDDWSRDVLAPLARDLGAHAIYPFEQPYPPFQRWAMKAGPCHPSPLGMFIHPDHGLWFGFRGALAFAEEISLPAPDQRPAPCEDCPDKPCLGACPVGAFSEEHGYDVPKCIDHIAGPDSRDCLSQGCHARRACPIGADARYSPEQAAFHMRAFLRNNAGLKT